MKMNHRQPSNRPNDNDEEDFLFCPHPVQRIQGSQPQRSIRQPVEDDETAHCRQSNENVERAYASQENWMRAIVTEQQAHQHFQSFVDTPNARELLHPKVHHNSYKLGSIVGRVVYGDGELVTEFSNYWKNLPLVNFPRGNRLKSSPPRNITCTMEVPSEGVIVDKSLYIDKETYDVQVNYERLTYTIGLTYGETTGSIKAVGAGQFGKVFFAVDRKTGQRFAEKVISMDKFNKDEVEILSRVQHPHIVQMYGVIRTSCGIHLLMQYAAGGNIDMLLLEGKGFVGGTSNQHDFNHYWSMLYYKQVMSALVYLHGKRIVHCDVKTSNVVLSSDKKYCFLADFGEASYMEGGKQFMKVTSSNGLIGTEHSMSPEVVEHGHFHYLSDVWSAGCLLLHMLNGSPPWSVVHPDLGTYLWAITTRPFAIHEEIPAWAGSLTTSILTSSFEELERRKSAEELLRLAERNFVIVARAIERNDSPLSTREESVSVEMLLEEASAFRPLPPCENVTSGATTRSRDARDECLRNGEEAAGEHADHVRMEDASTTNHCEELDRLLESIQLDDGAPHCSTRSTAHGGSIDAQSELDELLSTVELPPLNSCTVTQRCAPDCCFRDQPPSSDQSATDLADHNGHRDGDR